MVSTAAPSVGALDDGAPLAVVDTRAEFVVRAIRDDLRIHVAGSAATALAVLDAGDAVAAMVGHCELDRVGRGAEVVQAFEPMAFLPPPGRGFASLFVREQDEAAVECLADLDDPASRAALMAELSFAERAAGGVAIGAFASIDGELLALRAQLGRAEDGRLWFGDAAGPPSSAGELGRGLADRMLGQMNTST